MLYNIDKQFLLQIDGFCNFSVLVILLLALTEEQKI